MRQESWSGFLICHRQTRLLGRRCFHRYSENQTNQSLMRYICNREDKSWTRTVFSIFPSFYLHHSGLTLSGTFKAKIIKQFDNCREIWHLAPTIFRLVKILSVLSVRSYYLYSTNCKIIELLHKSANKLLKPDLTDLEPDAGQKPRWPIVLTLRLFMIVILSSSSCQSRQPFTNIVVTQAREGWGGGGGLFFVTFQSYLLLFYQKLDIILSLIKQSQDVDRINIKTLNGELWALGMLVCWLLFTM